MRNKIKYSELILVGGIPVFVVTLFSIKVTHNFGDDIFFIQKILAGYGLVCCLVMFVWMFANLVSRRECEKRVQWVIFFLFFGFIAAMIYYFVSYKKLNQ